MDDTRYTLSEFIKKHVINMASTPAKSNPNMPDNKWAGSHWYCVLHCGGAGSSMRTYFSMGAAHTRKPAVADVLSCLASDAAGYESVNSFEDWCGEYGYDTDSRAAERTYNAIKRQSGELREFLGDDLYDALIWNTERD